MNREERIAWARRKAAATAPELAHRRVEEEAERSTRIASMSAVRGLGDVEYATLEWVDWFNHHRILEPIEDVPPAECETIHRNRQDTALRQVS